MNQPDPTTDPQFGIDDCTCIPFTRQTDPPRYLNRQTDTVDMISGWERGRDCPHHTPAPQPADQTALRDRIRRAICEAEGFGWDTDMLEPDEYGEVADAVLAVLPATTNPADELSDTDRQFLTYALDLAADQMASRGGEFGDEDTAALEKPRRVADETTPATTAAAECSAQHHQFDDGRLCIRAAQHHGDHIDERGFHWSDTVAVYPLADGTWRTGTNARDALRRLAGEQPTPDTEADAPTLADDSEKTVRKHVTTLHLIGEQLTEVESWLWAHLADIRDAAVSAVAPTDEEA